MFTTENTSGFSEADLELANRALAALTDSGIDEQNASAIITNNWQPTGNTAESLSARANSNMVTLVGREAIDWARAMDVETLSKHADQTEGARRVSIDEAEQIASEDPSLIFAVLSADEAAYWRSGME